MQPRSGLFRFGPFQLDSIRRRVFRGDQPVSMSDRHVQILHLLVSNPGQILTRDLLIQSAWRGVAVADNSLEKAMSALRKSLGEGESGAVYIETLRREGYRFVAPVE